MRERKLFDGPINKTILTKYVTSNIFNRIRRRAQTRKSRKKMAPTGIGTELC